MPLPQPPRSIDKRFDDWVFALWKSVSSTAGASNAPAQGAATINGSQSVSAGNTAYVVNELEIAAQSSYEIGLGASLEIG
jgi:hypothetical protein